MSNLCPALRDVGALAPDCVDRLTQDRARAADGVPPTPSAAVVAATTAARLTIHPPLLPAHPAGTTCVTQYGKNVLKVSPCVTRSSHRGLLGSKSHKAQPKPTPKHTTTPSCRHVGDYVCLPASAHQKASTRYCQAGISRPCPAGTVCRTQPPHRRQSASPCVWP